ncbi:MAG: hypothetical protein OK456_08260 [Thaumarchaeota archaeon]|nr:hypothetical protein [Nitrososphaerota archaeon]
MTESPKGPSALPSKQFWEFADLGFDTGKKLWFIQFVNDVNQNVGSYFAKSVTLNKGRAIQYQWKDSQGRPFWHVRERFFADEIEGFVVDPAGAITINFKGEDDAEDMQPPKDFAYLLYAFHLSNKEGEKAPTGFVDFYNAKGEIIRGFNNRWIIIEGADRRTVGEFPKIRLRADRKDVGDVIVTRSAIIITGPTRGK